MRQLLGLAFLVVVGCGKLAPEIMSPEPADDEPVVREPSPCPDCGGKMNAPSPQPSPVQPAPEPTPLPLPSIRDERVPCALGERSALTFEIPADRFDGHGDGPAICSGVVEFYPNALGHTVCDAPLPPMRAHCGTVTFPDGEVEHQYCTIRAVCENGYARAVDFTW